MKFRHVFVFVCVVALVGAFLYSARPQWFSGLTATQRKDEADLIVRKVQVVLPVAGKDVPTTSDGTDIRQIIDLEEDGLPSRVNAYVLVINTGDKTFRHYRLTSKVKSASLRATPNSDVVARPSRVLNSNAPIQLEIWIPGNREVTLDVEYVANKS